MMRRIRGVAWAAAALVALGCTPVTLAQSLESFEAKLTEHHLDNGLTVLIYQRPTAPVVSFFTLVDVGSAQEVPGITGIAHMFEHMAFKGTSKIGTTDYEAEKKALEKVDEAFAAYEKERRKKRHADPEKLKQLKEALEKAQEEAGKYVKKNEFGEIIDRAGGVGLNAFTNTDQTGYFFSLPANKIELWAYLESERFLDPVFREFYKERDVVMEERRLRTESNPIGRLIEQAQSTAFMAHPYHQPVVGYMSDLMSITRQDAWDFYRKHYVPSNMVIAIVGQVDPDRMAALMNTYFGRLPVRPEPEPLRTEEPEQIAEKIVTVIDPSQPVYIEAYHKPEATHPDEAVYDVMADILSAGRTARLYRSLVRDKKIAAQTGMFTGFPGNKYPNLVLFFAIPTPDHTNEELQAAIRDEIARIQRDPVSDEELKRAKTRAKANLIRGLQSNQGIAGQLATYQTLYGDWRELFRHVERIEKVSKEDIQRVAKTTFKQKNRTIAQIVTEAADQGAE